MQGTQNASPETTGSTVIPHIDRQLMSRPTTIHGLAGKPKHKPHNPIVRRPITTPILLIGFGSIQRGFLPLLERHFIFHKDQVTIVEPVDSHLTLPRERGYTNNRVVFLDPNNYEAILWEVFGPPGSPKGTDTPTGTHGLVVNLSVDTGSVDLIRACRQLQVLYIDTVVEPWKGAYWDLNAPMANRTNYHLRETLLAERRAAPGGTTAVSCCGANPGMVSWLVKDALMTLAKDTGKPDLEKPTSQAGWAQLMCDLGVKGVHIAERDTQRPRQPKPLDVFWNTWSVEGFLSEGFQPAELGWGTHEKWTPANAKQHEAGCKAAIYLEQPGAFTRVRTWCPSLGQQHGFLVTHNESISIADYYTVPGESEEKPHFRPTCHYAYHPCDSAVLALHQCQSLFSQEAHKELHVLTEDEIVTGMDELGVLLYGHAKNALWLGSTLTHEETIAMCPQNNATAMQVTSAILAGILWAYANPEAGIVEADDMDHDFCLNIQKPYLGTYWHRYTDWTPLDQLVRRPPPQSTSGGTILASEGHHPNHGSAVGLFPPLSRTDLHDPWQFANVLV